MSEDAQWCGLEGLVARVGVVHDAAVGEASAAGLGRGEEGEGVCEVLS